MMFLESNMGRCGNRNHAALLTIFALTKMIYDDLSKNMRFQKLHFYNTMQIDTTMRNNGMIRR